MSPAPPRSFALCDPATDLGPGIWLLEASAGTGKTYTIVGILTRLLIETDIGLDESVVMTFTRAATAELRERLRLGLQRALAVVEGRQEPDGDPFLSYIAAAHGGRACARRRLRRALIDLDGALIATIHGFCNRLLRDHALSAAVPLGAELSGDLTSWRDACLHDILRDWARRLSPVGADLVAPALAPATLAAHCQRLENHPHVCFTGQEALAPEAVETLLATVRAQWPAWREAVLHFFADHAARLGPGYGPRELRQRLDALAVWWHQGGTREQLDDLLRSLVDPDFSTAAKRALKDQAWHGPLLALARSTHGVERHILETYRAHLADRPRRHQHLHYSDLLGALDTSLASARGEELRAAVARRYHLALVDEFQDTDQVQWSLFRRLFGAGHQRLFLIGDPKQAIYAFRGADVHAYLAAAADIPTARRSTLGTNYRSDADLVAAVNDFFDRGPATFVDSDIPFQRVDAHHGNRFAVADDDGPQAPLQIWWQEATRRVEETRHALARRCAHEAARLLVHGQRQVDGAWCPLRPRDIAVLVPSHHLGGLIAAAFTALPRPIPCVRIMRASVFAGDMARELDLVLSAVLAPHRERAVRAAALTRLAGLSVAALADPTQHRLLEDLAQRLRVLRQLWNERGFGALWQEFLDRGIGSQPPRVFIAAGADGERDLTDLSHLGDLLTDAAGAGGQGPEALVLWLERAIAEPGRGGDERLLRLDRDDEAVRIMTIHASKGLEFPVVFAPFLWAGTHKTVGDDPIYYHGHEARWHCGPKSTVIRQAQRAATLAEQMRLAYVAVTRARHRCYLAFVPQPARGHGAGCTTAPLTWLAWGAGRVDPARLGERVKEAWKQDPDWPEAVAQGLCAPHHRYVTLVRDQDPPAWVAPDLERGAVDFPDHPVATWRMPRRTRAFSSYSGLIRHRPVDEPDYDQLHVPDALAVEDDGLPRGARFGTAMHAVFEHVEFTAAVPALEAESRRQLAAQGLDETHAPALARLVARVLAAPLPGGEESLCTVARYRCAELEVLLPVERRRAIAAAFATHGGAWRSYAEDIADLELPQGFFTGIIDLVFVHRGRFHLADWKSNDLAGKGGYGADAVRREMRHHHYVLQYHLYLVALQRYLRLRLAAYDPAVHLGEAHYLFVRGVDGRGAGWYRDRPSQAMIDALDACFGDRHGR